LFRNEGDGTFTDVAGPSGIENDRYCKGVTLGDYDDDGDLDVYLSNFGANRLYRNEGGLVFRDVALELGVEEPADRSFAAWFFDYDNDGRLDLFVTSYAGGIAELAAEALDLQRDRALPRLYRNLGGTFEDVTEAVGLDRFFLPMGANFGDLDGDGWLDLYINNDVSTNRLFHNLGRLPNQGESTVVEYADLSAITGTADPRGSMGLSVGEIGAMSDAYDGLPDLFITHWLAQENAFYLSVRLPGGGFEYRDKTRQFRVGEISIDTVGWGSALCDLDLDGRLDIAVANGSTLEQKRNHTKLIAEPLFLLWNDGKRFVNIAPDAGAACARRHCARGLAAADFDGDGDIDLAIAINRGQPLLLRNETVTSNRSLSVLLRGPAVACFGARIELVVNTERQVRWCGADVTFMGMHAAQVVFGLGKSERAEELQVRWADGRSSRVENVAAGRVVVDHAKSVAPRKPR
jgi:hypothetical protein